MGKYLIIFILLAQTAIAQKTPTRDTSIAIQSNYEKLREKYPQIVIAYPELSKKAVVKKNIPYRHISSRDLLLDIYHPKKLKKKLPAVLLVFGGGWRSGDKSQNAAMATELVNNGFVVISSDYRLSNEAIYPAALYDLKAALRWMRSHANLYGIDTNRIAIMGCSAGGQLAALVATTNNAPPFEDQIGSTGFSSRVHAALDLDGILAFKHPESEENVSASLWLGGNYEQQPANWEQASALTHAGPHTVPILFINSSLPRFHAGRDDMIAILNKWNIYTEVHTMPDSPHIFWYFHPWFEPTMKYSIAFLKKIFKQ